MVANVNVVVLPIAVHVCQPNSAWLLLDTICNGLCRALIDEEGNTLPVGRLVEESCEATIFIPNQIVCYQLVRLVICDEAELAIAAVAIHLSITLVSLGSKSRVRSSYIGKHQLRNVADGSSGDTSHRVKEDISSSN